MEGKKKKEDSLVGVGGGGGIPFFSSLGNVKQCDDNVLAMFGNVRQCSAMFDIHSLSCIHFRATKNQDYLLQHITQIKSVKILTIF